MKLSEVIIINESSYTLSSYIASLGRNSIPTRLRVYIDSEFGGNYNQFINAVAMFERRNPREASRILNEIMSNPIRLNRLPAHIRSSEETVNIPTVSFHQVQNRGSRLLDDPRQLIDNTGNPPSYLFRFVSREEMDYIESQGFIAPSQFYGRVHASYAPDRRYMLTGGTLLTIKYDNRDEWRAKRASDEVYAVTDRRIDISKVSKVRI